jgi:hypothetical protein
MPYARSKGRSQHHRSDYQQNHGPGVAEMKPAAMHFAQKKKDADGDHDCRTGEAAGGAALAFTVNLCAHFRPPRNARI